MNIGIIGSNLTSLTLAKALVNKKINVTLFHKSSLKPFKSNRCLGITNQNLDFFNEKIFKIEKKLFNQINEIKIYFENNLRKETLKFKKKNFSILNIIKIEKLISVLEKKLKKTKNYKEIKIRNNSFYNLIIKNKKFDLIFNCEKNNILTKNFFNQSYKKDYKSEAITCNLNHKKIINKEAVQIFTKFGPLAFLPLSSSETAVVFSMYNKRNKYSDKEILQIIKSYNKNYLIKKNSKIERAKLTFFSARKYSSGRILLFGDILHQIHPLAGQGFNMTLRDLDKLLEIIQKKIDLGLNFDSNIMVEFEKKVRHYNFIYSNGINFIQDFFEFDSKYKNNFSKKIINLIGQNKFINNFFMKVADRGININ